MSIDEILTKKSRDAYLSLCECLTNTELLDELSGKSSILDLALLKAAEIINPEIYEALKLRLNYDEVVCDILHCYKSSQLQLRRKDQIATAIAADSKGD